MMSAIGLRPNLLAGYFLTSACLRTTVFTGYMKIALFDDHPIVLEGLNHYFSKKEGVDVVGTARTKSEVLQLLASQPIDILISDVITDEELGLELFEEIQAGNFETKVVVYSSLQGELVHNFLYEYGVVAIVNKMKGLDELWQMVELAYLTTEYKKKSDGSPPPSLTPKEKEIVPGPWYGCQRNCSAYPNIGQYR
jgi:DNA-binding NarL/FixJ family response regulator